MEVFHCNGCAHLPQYAGPADQRRYFISSCGHVFCQNCAVNSKDVCGVCKAACRLVEVNAQSKPEIKAYFMDPMSVLRESLKQAAQVFQFQKAQIKSFQSVVSRLVEANKRTNAEKETLKKSNTALEQENMELKRKIETMEQEHQSWIGSGGRTNEGFSMESTGPTTPSRSFSIFGDKAPGDSFTRGFLGTPANTPFGGRNTPNPLFTSGSAANPSSNGSGIFFGPGRLTMPRTPNSESAQTPERFSPRFSPAPGSGRPIPIGTTPDVVSRLRQLRCSAAGSSTPNSQFRSNRF